MEDQGYHHPLSYCIRTDLSTSPSLLSGFPDSSVGKESACNAGDPGLHYKITTEILRPRHSGYKLARGTSPAPAYVLVTHSCVLSDLRQPGAY